MTGPSKNLLQRIADAVVLCELMKIQRAGYRRTAPCLKGMIEPVRMMNIPGQPFT